MPSSGISGHLSPPTFCTDNVKCSPLSSDPSLPCSQPPPQTERKVCGGKMHRHIPNLLVQLVSNLAAPVIIEEAAYCMRSAFPLRLCFTLSRGHRDHLYSLSSLCCTFIFFFSIRSFPSSYIPIAIIIIQIFTISHIDDSKDLLNW